MGISVKCGFGTDFFLPQRSVQNLVLLVCRLPLLWRLKQNIQHNICSLNVTPSIVATLKQCYNCFQIMSLNIIFECRVVVKSE